MGFIMKKRGSGIFKFICKVLVCLLIGVLWWLYIIPIAFYFTFADMSMKEQTGHQLLSDPGEFYGLVYQAKKDKSRGYPLRLSEKALLVAGKISDIGLFIGNIGYFIWLPLGILWGISDRLPEAARWCRLRIASTQHGS